MSFKKKDGLLNYKDLVKFDAHIHLCRVNWKPLTKNLSKFLKEIMDYRSQISEEEICEGVIKSLKFMLEKGVSGYISHQIHRHIRSSILICRGFPLDHNFARMCTDNHNHPQNIYETPLLAINETIKLANEFPNIGILFGPMGLVDCSLEMFEAYGANENKHTLIGLHTHVAEDQHLTKRIKKKYGKSEIELLSETGCLLENTFLIHCTYVSEEDIEIIKSSNSKIVICPRSSFNMSTFKLILKHKIRFLLGTDSFDPDDLGLDKELDFIKNQLYEIA